MFNKSITPLVVAFLVIGAFILIFREFLQSRNVDWQVLSGGNLIIYIITVVSLHLLTRSLHAESTHAFLRSAYSGILIKLFACAGVAFVYILMAGDNLNKNALFLSMLLYLVYSFIEMRVIMAQSKQKKNG